MNRLLVYGKVKKFFGETTKMCTFVSEENRKF